MKNDYVVPSSRASAAPIDAGCPHCGGTGSHPHSSRPAVTSDSQATRPAPAIVPPKPVAVAVAAPATPERATGKHAYDIWVRLVGHTEFAVDWDKLTGNAQRAWIGVADDVERRTVEFLGTKLGTKNPKPK